MQVSDVVITTTSKVLTITTQAFENVLDSSCPQALAIGVVSKMHLA
jgi:CRP-like cAMP-binding protein